MRILIYLAIFCVFLGTSSYTIAKENRHDSVDSRTPKIDINSVKMKITKSKEPDLSVSIGFVNRGLTLNNWQLGFYMVSTSFYQLVNKKNNYNSKLKMLICNNRSQNDCVKLNYEKRNHVTENDLSQGYTHIFSPVGTFPLVEGESYTVKLLHNTQWSQGNISYFPQNFFFIIPEDHETKGGSYKVYCIQTDQEVYSLINYDQKSIQAAIDTHIEENWHSSIPYNSANQGFPLIPSPVQVKTFSGQNNILEGGIIIHNQLNHNNQIAVMIAKSLLTDVHVNATVDNQTDALTGIIIQPMINKSLLQNNPEGYMLEINEENIKISALHSAGVYYAFQTLRQLWNSKKNNSGAVLPMLNLIDYPRFKYRGILLDTARHFFSVVEIHALIDLMGAHKLNTLHIHFSDDEAFRLALPDYPSLRSIAGVRAFGLPMGPMMFPQGNLYKSYNEKDYIKADCVYHGIYSPDDITNIIRYANANQITVIPEIDLPAHARALIKALPDAFIDPNDHSQFISAQGYTDNVLPVCSYNANDVIGQKFTKTINHIVYSVAQLFNKQKTLYAVNNEISIGGDEVSSNAWTQSPSCQGSWDNLTALQKSHRFFHLLSLENTTLALSGWQQFLQTNTQALGNTIVSPEKTGHVWVWSTSKLGIEQASTLANNAYQVVLAFSNKTYFDLAYSPNILEPGLNWAALFGDTQAALSLAMDASNTLQKTNTASQVNIVGLEGALWSENLVNYDQMIYMALPKMAGLAESSWSSSSITHDHTRVNWQSLTTRLGCGKTGFLDYLTKLYNVRYRGYPNGIKLEVPPQVCD